MHFDAEAEKLVLAVPPSKFSHRFENLSHGLCTLRYDGRAIVGT